MKKRNIILNSPFYCRNSKRSRCFTLPKADEFDHTRSGSSRQAAGDGSDGSSPRQLSVQSDDDAPASTGSGSDDAAASNGDGKSGRGSALRVGTSQKRRRLWRGTCIRVTRSPTSM